MYCKTITKEIFDSYIANDSDSVLEGVVTNTFEGTTPLPRGVRLGQPAASLK